MIRSLATLLCTAAILPAQSLSLEALQPLEASAVFGVMSQVSTLPAGPLTDWTILTATAGTLPDRSRCEVSIQTSASDNRLRFLLGVYCRIDSTALAPFASASADMDLLLHVDLPPQTRVWLSHSPLHGAPSGSAVPVFDVDIGNDGTTEWTQASGMKPSLTRTVGTSPLPIRVRVALDLLMLGEANLTTILDITPRDTIASPYVAGCGNAATVAGRFDGGLQFDTSSAQFAVFGLQPAPVLLAPNPALPFDPCLLIPALDLVAYVPAGQFVLPVPPSVRPIVLWGQGVSLSGGTLRTGTAYRVTAQ